ncbi:MAG: hypothetical protein ACJ719_14330 [Nitrososphaeraceae archaeon]
MVLVLEQAGFPAALTSDKEGAIAAKARVPTNAKTIAAITMFTVYCYLQLYFQYAEYTYTQHSFLTHMMS